MAIDLLLTLSARSRWVVAVIQRVWPLALATYLTLVVWSPYERALYGFGATWVTAWAFSISAVLLVASACFPTVPHVNGASVAVTSWSLMGRTFSFTFSDAKAWDAVLGFGLYAVVTLAFVILYFVNVAIVVGQQDRRRARGDG